MSRFLVKVDLDNTPSNMISPKDGDLKTTESEFPQPKSNKPETNTLSDAESKTFLRATFLKDHWFSSHYSKDLLSVWKFLTMTIFTGMSVPALSHNQELQFTELMF